MNKPGFLRSSIHKCAVDGNRLIFKKPTLRAPSLILTYIYSQAREGIEKTRIEREGSSAEEGRGGERRTVAVAQRTRLSSSVVWRIIGVIFSFCYTEKAAWDMVIMVFRHAAEQTFKILRVRCTGASQRVGNRRRPTSSVEEGAGGCIGGEKGQEGGASG